ncbi:MAG: UvrD-helicase domain-containing protein [Bryobacteraceae bacterium]
MPEFTAHQLDAIEYRRQDACVVAGPGSGKTSVLVERYRSLIETHRFEPRNVLAITFTEKAAANMKARLAELFAHDPIRLRELESAYVSTIHGFCARVLRDNAIAAGIDPRFSVLDARESEEMQFFCLNGALDELVDKRRTEALELIEALHKPDLAGDLRNVYDGIRSAGKTIAEVRAMENPGVPVNLHDTASRLRELVASWPSGLTPARQRQRDELLEWVQRLDKADGSRLSDFVQLIADFPSNRSRVPEVKDFKESLPELIAWAVDRHTARFREIVFDVLTRFEELYSERKSAAASLDFNDLERRTVELLRENAEVQDRIRAQFRQVMLDEFQDINEQQAELIALIRGEDVFFAVGDANQSIYGFRHARPEIFHRYRAQIEDSGKHSTDLLHNFRSRTEILRCVEALLNGAEGIDQRELVAGCAFPRKTQPSIEILKIHDVVNNEAKDEAAAEVASREARWIAHRILSLRGTLQIGAIGNTRSADFGDFAILCRNSESMKPILEAFNIANIPYVCGRRQSFLLSREGLDITALLHTIANPRDGIALATVLRSNLVGVGEEALLRIRLLAGSLSGGMNLLAYDKSKLTEFAPEDAQKLTRFMESLKRWRTEQPVLPLEVLIVRALSDCGFQWIPGTLTAGNVESFLHLARTRGEERGLAGLLHEIESLQKAVSLESDLSDEDQGDCVQVMTAHSAKGLEFPITIIAAMDKGTQRNSAPVTFTPTFGLGLKWKDPGGKPRNTGLDDSWQLRNAEYLKEREKHEAHRLLYVAMTRAEEHLILSYSRGKNRPSNWAKIVDEFFQLDSHKPSDDPQTGKFAPLGGETFDVSICVTDSQPPPLRAAATDLANSEGVLTVPRPAVHEQHDSAVNVTSLTVFADCPRKYYLQRYVGWNGRFRSMFDPEELPDEEEGEEENEPADLTASELGTLVHEILAEKSGPYPEEAQRLADVFLRSDLGKRAAAAGRSEREWEFIVDIGGTLVRGTIDLWFEEKGEIVIVDYKTDTRERPESYAPQLALYGFAIERAFGKRPIQAWLHFLRSNLPIEVPLDDAAIHRVQVLLAELAHAQDALRFDLREGEHCRTCQFYRVLCPAGSLSQSPLAQA